jgi:hypothetical protein
MWEKAHMQRTLLPGSSVTYEESFIEIEILLVKTYLFNVAGTVIQKKTEWRTEICCEDGIPFANPHTLYHISNPPHFPFYANLPGLHSHTSEIGIFPSVQNPSRTHYKFCNELQHPISPFKILILNSRLVHNTLLPPAAYSLAHVTLWRKYFVTNNIFRTVELH